MTANMYDYYAKQSVRPTFADFDSDAQLSNYAALRKTVFTRLFIPPGFFAGKDVLEFGPDTGENALVLARWGARVTLVEPNVAAHAQIEAYFERFSLKEQLAGVTAESVLGYQPPRRFHAVLAEGFIYTVQPTTAWLEKLAACLARDGLAVVSYMELYGGFLELLIKAIYSNVAGRGGYGAGVDVARKLFQPKWDNIPHTRTFDSWFMDVVENPFVRLSYFLDPADLIAKADSADLALYSSWPSYRDALAVNWLKAPESRSAELASSTAFVERSALSRFLGMKCFLGSASPGILEEMRRLIRETDRLVDVSSPGESALALQHIDNLIRMVRDYGDLVVDDLAAAMRTLEMYRTAIRLMDSKDAGDLIAFCRNDEQFVKQWGMPANHVVLRNVGS